MKFSKEDVNWFIAKILEENDVLKQLSGFEVVNIHDGYNPLDHSSDAIVESSRPFTTFMQMLDDCTHENHMISRETKLDQRTGERILTGRLLLNYEGFYQSRAHKGNQRGIEEMNYV